MKDETFAARNRLKDLPANHTPPNMRAFGRAPHFYGNKKDMAPMFPRMKVTAFLNAKPDRMFDAWLIALGVLSFVMLGLVLILKGEMM